MIKDVLNNLREYKPLFDGHENKYNDLKAMLEQTKDNKTVSEGMDSIVNHYLQSLGRIREYENIEVLKQYQEPEGVVRTMAQMDIECARSNRYQQELTLVAVKLELLDNSVPMEEGLKESIKVIRQHIRKPDYIGLYKEDCLLVLLPNTNSLLSKNVITKFENQLNSMMLLYGWRISFTFCMTNYNRWEGYDILLKRLDFGIQKGKRDQTAIVQI